MEEQSSIPVIRARLELIQELQTREFWQDVTPVMLERVRKQMRSLVKLIEKAKRQPIYTDFEDELGISTSFDLLRSGDGSEFEQFKKKALQFLRGREDIPSLRKLRQNQALTPADMNELEAVLMSEGVGTAADIDRAKQEGNGLGLFIRSLVGLDREAAKRAFAEFLDGRTATGNQIEFVNLIIDYLTEHGAMSPALLYESPFTDVSAKGPDGLFSTVQVDAIIKVLRDIQLSAAA